MDQYFDSCICEHDDCMIPVVALLMVIGFIRIVYLKYKLVKRAKENPEIVKIEIEINELDLE